MGEMVVGIPARPEKIEREVGLSRRNSTGSLGIQITKSKVLSRYLSDPKGSCHDACKGVERDLQTTKARTSLLRRSNIAASEKTQELTTTVKLQIRKKPLRSSKLAVNFKRRTTGKAQRQENPAYTKRLAVSGGSPFARDSPLDGATSTPNKGSRMDKNTGSSKLSNKKAVGKPANLRRLTTSHEEEMQECTKTLAVSASHRRDSKLQPLEENAYSVSSNKSRRRYSDVIITGGSAILQGSLLDDATSKPNTGSKTDKDAGSYEFSKKTDVGVPVNHIY